MTRLSSEQKVFRPFRLSELLRNIFRPAYARCFASLSNLLCILVSLAPMHESTILGIFRKLVLTKLKAYSISYGSDHRRLKHIICYKWIILAFFKQEWDNWVASKSYTASATSYISVLGSYLCNTTKVFFLTPVRHLFVVLSVYSLGSL